MQCLLILVPTNTTCIGLQSLSGNLGFWGSNPTKLRQKPNWIEEGNGKPPHTLPCDWPSAIGPAQVGRIITQKNTVGPINSELLPYISITKKFTTDGTPCLPVVSVWLFPMPSRWQTLPSWPSTGRRTSTTDTMRFARAKRGREGERDSSISGGEKGIRRNRGHQGISEKKMKIFFKVNTGCPLPKSLLSKYLGIN